MHHSVSKSHPKAYLPLLLSFIIINETTDNYIFNIFSSLATRSHTLEFMFFLFFLVTQIIASPIQAGYSDFYCRKKSLMIALSFSAASLIPAFLFFESVAYPLVFLSILTLVKGIAGNILPLSWAGIADTQTKNVRLSFGLSTAAIGLGYLSLIVLNVFFKTKGLAFVIFLLLIILMILCAKFFFDIRDKKNSSIEDYHPSIIAELKDLTNNFLGNLRFRNALLSYLFWEISFYSIHMLDVDLQIVEFKGLTLSMITGYLIGVVFLKLIKKDDYQVIKLGYTISIISILPILILNVFIESIVTAMMAGYFIYALAAAFLAPSLFAILAKERPPHEQGKIYGLVDSTDTVALLFSAITVMLYNHYKFKPFVIVIFSLVFMVLSWLPYAKFKKSSPLY